MNKDKLPKEALLVIAVAVFAGWLVGFISGAFIFGHMLKGVI